LGRFGEVDLLHRILAQLAMGLLSPSGLVAWIQDVGYPRWFLGEGEAGGSSVVEGIYLYVGNEPTTHIDAMGAAKQCTGPQNPVSRETAPPGASERAPGGTVGYWTLVPECKQCTAEDMGGKKPGPECYRLTYEAGCEILRSWYIPGTHADALVHSGSIRAHEQERINIIRAEFSGLQKYVDGFVSGQACGSSERCKHYRLAAQSAYQASYPDEKIRQGKWTQQDFVKGAQVPPGMYSVDIAAEEAKKKKKFADEMKKHLERARALPR
jgi:hypothetical protein